jgi:hypothetical protein
VAGRARIVDLLHATAQNSLIDINTLILRQVMPQLDWFSG